MKTLEIEVKEPIKLLELIEEVFPDSSRTKHKEILAHRVIIASRHITQYDFPLAAGMKVTIEGDENRNKPMRGNMPIVYEDKYLFVVNKPVGLLSSSTHPDDRTVISELNNYLMQRRSRQRAHVVHRLDRDTSGLLLVAKTKDVARAFEKDWKERVYDRAYVAVTWGAPVPASGMVKSWLTENEYGVVSSPIDNGGKLAITHYKTLRKQGRFALVQMQLETGRRNQIRVHMREIGHPLLKDPIYGYRDDNSPIDRLALHAFRLYFKHPVTEKDVRLETPFPDEFMTLFSK
ncbi:MAG: RluA family pseudouridine synthase [Bacteroidales bacterium]|nr:RluA family pseudouridine synthase [Bacteroidales bacterium]